MSKKKYLYLFSEGNKDMREILGGKGANLAEMTNAGMPVPQGFTISTEACTQYYNDGRQINEEIMADIYEYIGKLEELEAAGLNTDEQHRQYHNTLALLCQVVPELADYIDLETDTINGGTEALRANTEAWKQNAMQQAYQDQLTELYSQYSAVLIEAEENSIGLTKAQYSLEAAQQKLSDTYAQMDALWADAQKQADAYYDQYGYYTDATAFLSQEYYDLQNSIYDTNNEIWAAEKSIKNYNKAMEEDADAVSDAEAEIALAEEAVKNLTASMNEGTGASEEAAAQVSEFQAAISGVQEKINALVESYNEAYSAAYESISGQYQLWDEAAKVVATSAGSINSALESQITYWQDYNANLQTLTERSADIEGLSEMIASFADGTVKNYGAALGEYHVAQKLRRILASPLAYQFIRNVLAKRNSRRVFGFQHTSEITLRVFHSTSPCGIRFCNGFRVGKLPVYLRRVHKLGLHLVRQVAFRAQALCKASFPHTSGDIRFSRAAHCPAFRQIRNGRTHTQSCIIYQSRNWCLGKKSFVDTLF